MEEYAAIFGEYPATFGLPDTPEGIGANILKAIADKRPLWSYYFDRNPYTGDRKTDI
jgi:hypothetical protein